MSQLGRVSLKDLKNKKNVSRSCAGECKTKAIIVSLPRLPNNPFGSGHQYQAGTKNPQSSLGKTIQPAFGDLFPTEQ